MMNDEVRVRLPKKAIFSEPPRDRPVVRVRLPKKAIFREPPGDRPVVRVRLPKRQYSANHRAMPDCSPAVRLIMLAK